MSSYVLCNSVVFQGIELRKAKIISDTAYDVPRLVASGAILVLMPNAIVEARAAEVRAQQARGRRDGELDDLTAAFAETAPVGGGAVTNVSGAAPINVTGPTATPTIGIDLATTATPGSLSAADKSKLDGIAAGATNTALASTAPADVDRSAAAVGVGSTAARADHKHDISVGTPMSVGTANAAGASAALARADHVHAVPFTPVQAALAAATGDISVNSHKITNLTDPTNPQDAATLAYVNTISGVALATLPPVNVTKATAAVGTGTTAARDDHKHDVGTAAPGATGVSTASAEGAATTLARSDHSHQSNTAPADVTKAAAAVGTSGEPARADHKHDVTTAAPAAAGVGTASGEGTATTLARSDHSHQSNTAPALSTKSAAVVGTSTEPARADHKHDVSTAAPAATGVSTASAEGTATSMARSDHSHQSNTAPALSTKAAAVIGTSGEPARADHKHDVSTAAPTATGVSTASAEGTATSMARSDHSHQSNTTPTTSTRATAVIGTSGEPARADHKHDVSTAAPGATSVATASADGAATSLARSDHTHQSNTAPANVTKAAAAIGTSGEPARADHKHDVTTAVVGAITIAAAAAEGTATSLARSDHVHSLAASATPQSIGTANATGTGTAAAREDHVHNHGAQTSGTLHAVATTSVAGFLSAADKTKLDGVPTGGFDIRDVLVWDHLISGNISSDSFGSAGWRLIVAGTGSDQAMTPEAGHPGVADFGIGSTAAGRCAMYLGESGILNFSLLTTQNQIECEWLVKLNAAALLSTSLERIVIGFGSNFDAVAGTEHTDGLYCEFNPALSANFQFVNAVAGVRTRVDSTIPPTAATWFRIGLRITYPAGVPTVELLINGFTRVTSTVTFPSASLGFGIRGDANVNAAEPRFQVDYARLIQVTNKET